MVKASTSAPVAPCLLCKKESTLQWSHIVPNWVYRRVIKFYGDDNKKMVMIGDGVRRYGIDQMAEYMLCVHCEKRCKAWEDVAAALSLQQLDGAKESFPALATAKVIAQEGSVVVADVSALNTDSLTRFAVSVIWRAHTSKKHLPKVNLGRYAEPVRAVVLQRDGTS